MDTQTQDFMKFLGLMASKFCHDLATPIGSLDMGLGLLDPGSKVEADTKDLLQKSSDLAKHRLKIYRTLLIFSDGSPALNEVLSLIRPYAIHHNITFNVVGGADYSGSMARLILGALTMCVEGLPRGGTLSLHLSEDTLQINAQGSVAKIRTDYADFFQTEQDMDLSAQSYKTVFPFYLSILAAQNDKEITYQTDNGSFALKIS